MSQTNVIARVISLSGEAFARDAAGKMRRLKVGDVVREGESVDAGNASQAILKLADGREISVRPGEVVRIDAEVAASIKPDAMDSALSSDGGGFKNVAKALNSGKSPDELIEEEEPAAGIPGGRGNEGHTFVELLRVAETVDRQSTHRIDGFSDRVPGGEGRAAVILGSELTITVVAPDNTNDTTPTITGQTQLAAGSSITLTIKDSAGATQILTALVAADGSFSVDVPVALPDGGYSVVATGIDLLGNTGYGYDTGSVDATPPALSVQLDPKSDTGQLGDNVTLDNTPSIIGTGEPGATVNITMPGTGEHLSTVVGASGTWSLTPTQPIGEGSVVIVVTATDSAGNITSKPLNITIDTVQPVLPEISSATDDVGSIQGTLANGAKTDDPTPTLNGTGEIGSTIKIYDGSNLLGSTVVDGNGTWRFTPGTGLGEGQHNFTAVSEDKAGNRSGPSNTYGLELDFTAPIPPEITSVLDDVGAVQGALQVGATTDDAKPEVKGSAEPGATVQVYDGTTLLGSTVAGANGAWTFTPEKPLLTGLHNLTAVAVDAAGNPSLPSNAFGFTLIGSGAPAAPVIVNVLDDVDPIIGNVAKSTGITNDANPEIKGTAEAGAKVTLYDGTSILGSVVADAKGNWSFTPTTALLDGVHNITATATNAAGNVSPSTGIYDFTVDTTAPLVPTITSVVDDVGLIKGLITNGTVTDDTTPTVNGTGEAGATIKIYDGTTLLGSALVGASGSWSFTPTTALSNGGHSLAATQTDVAGNTGPVSGSVSFTIDTSTVTSPTITSVQDDVGTMTGAVAQSGTTDDTKPTIIGTAPAGTTIHVYDGTVLLGSTVTDAFGSWSYTPGTALADGAHSFTATATNAAGTVSAPTAAYAITIDTVQPVLPEISSATDDVGSIQGTLANGAKTDDPTPTLNGTGEIGSTIKIYDGSNLLGSTVVDGNGTWRFTPGTGLGEGQHNFTAVSEDKAGNRSGPSNTYGLELDFTAPIPPEITSVLDDVGAVQGALQVGATTDDAKPEVKGSAEPGATVQVYDGTTLLGSTVAGANGAWTFTPEKPLLTGLHNLTAVAVDAAGNPSLPSNAFGFTLIGSGAPAAPVIVNVLDDVDPIIGNVAKSTGITNDANPEIKGTAEAGAKVTLYDGTSILGSVVADAKGNWSFTPTTALLDGVHNITATATNAAGNVSPSTGIYDFTVDTTAPLVPTITSVVDDVGLIKGLITNGTVTDDTTPTVNGTGEAGATIKIYDGTTLLGSALVGASGSWSFTPTTALSNGGHSLAATQTDVAGNTGPVSGSVSFTIDTSTVTSPTITSVQDDVGTMTGAVAQSGTTDDTKPTIIGTAPAGTTIHVYDGTVLLGSTVTDAFGSWSYTPGTALADGAHSFTATATNAAGTVSAPTAAYAITIDTVQPVLPEISSATDDVGSIQGTLANGAKTDDPTPTLNGTGEIGSTIKIYDGSNLLGSTVVDGNGTWRFTPGTGLGEGQHNFTAVSEDKAGNRSGPSNTYGLELDFTAPIPPEITSVLDDVGAVQGALQVGATTDDAKPEVKGSAEPGATVQVYDGTTLLGSTVAGANGAWTFTPENPLLTGLHNLTAVAVDAAGNPSLPSNAFGFTLIGSGAPAAPVIVNVLDDVDPITGNVAKSTGITNDANPEIKGTAEAGAKVTLYDGTSILGSVVADAKGNWSFTPTTALLDGVHNITATATNAAGNVSPSTGIYDFTVDTTAPLVPTITSVVDDVGLIKGLITNGTVTDDTTPTVNGTGEAGATIKIYDGTTLLGSALVGASGSWSFTPTTALSNGGHSLAATQTDVAGNTGPVSGSVSFTIDTSTVTSPTITSVQDDVGTMTGAVAQSGTTDDTKPTIIGTAPAGTTIHVYDGTVLLGSTVTDAFGSWSYTPGTALADGAHSFTATATNAAGTVSAPTAAYAITIDTVQPVVPEISSATDDVGSIQGTLANGAKTDDPTPTLNGTGEIGSTIKIYDGSNLLGSTVVDGNGTWRFTPGTGLGEGQHNFTAVSEDKAGNRSGPSNTYGLELDFTAPIPPEITSVLDDVGAVQGALQVGATTDDAKPEVKGSAEPGATVQVYDGATLLGSTVAGANGAWTFTPENPLLTGLHNLTAVAVDAAGNPSLPSNAFGFTLIGSGAPAAPVIVNVLDDVDPITGNVAKSTGITNDANPEIKGTAEAGAKVTLYDGTSILGSVVADAKGNWSFTPTTALLDGVHNITATATNAAGNVSPSTGIYDFTVDTTAPLVPTITSVVDDVGLIKGLITNGTVTDDTTPTVNGTGEAGATIKIYDGTTLLGSALVGASGSWSFTPTTALSNGGHSLAATQTDVAGNTGPVSGSVSFTIDTSTVTSPTITSVQDDVGTMTGAVAQSGTTDDTKPTIIGTAPAGTTIHVYDGTVLLGSTVTDAFGSWSYTPGTALADGAHSFTATATNAAGTVSAPTAAYAITIDTVQPVVPEISSATDDVGSIQGTLANGAKTDDPTPTLNGTGEIGSTIKIYDGSNLLGSTVVDGNGTWRFTPGTGLGEGQHNFTAVSEDKAGNRSGPSNTYGLELDFTAPIPPEITSVLDDVGAVQGALQVGATTDDAKPEVKGSAEPGATVQVYDGATLLGSTVAGANGAWTFTPENPLLTGLHNLTAVAVDAAGNPSLPSNAFGFTLIGSGAPAAPVIVNVLDDVDPITGNVAKSTGITNDANPEIKGTAEAGAKVTLYDGTSILGSVVADAKGNWSFTPTTALLDGVHNITATATNAAGNVSPSTGIYDFTVDTTAPLVPTITSVVDDVGLIKGLITNGTVTDDTTPTVNGTGEAGATIKIYDGTTLLGSALVGASGSWSFTPTTALSNGGHSLAATQTDVAGNTGPVSGSVSFTIDTSTVTSPTITSVQDDVGTMTGAVAQSGTTDDTKPTIIGTAPAGTTIHVYDGTLLLGSTVTDAFGSWSYTPGTALADGAHSFTATATNAAGTVSAPTAAYAITIDTVQPVLPEISSATDDVGSIQGTLQNGAKTDDPTPTLNGTGEIGSTIKIYDGSNLLGSTVVDGNGTWRFTPGTGLGEGQHNFTAVSEDKAGNRSGPSNTYGLELDFTAPIPPEITSVLDDVGAVQGALQVGATTDDAKPEVKGSAEPGATVQVYDGTTLLGSTVAGANGAWTFTPENPLLTGLHNLTAVAVDAAGNPSLPSNAFGFTLIGSGAPAAPVIVNVLDDVDPIIGNVAKSTGITNDANPEIKGTAEAGAKVTLYDGTSILGSVVADAKGNWSFTPTTALLDGVHNITATATNAAGNVSPSTGIYDFTVDTTAPLVPTITSVVDDVGLIKGLITNGTVTDDTTPTVNGTGEAGATIKIYDGTTLLGSALVGASGSWSFTPTTALSNGGHSLAATQTDVAGNTGPVSGSVSFMIDTSTVTSPTITSVQDDVGTMTGAVAQSGTTDDTKPTIIGTAPAGTTIHVYDGTVLLGSTVTDAFGSWSYTPGTALADGAHSFTATATNAAGTVSAPTAAYAITIDTVQPVLPEISSATDDVGSIQGTLANGAKTDDPTPTLNGTGEIGSTIKIYDGSNLLGSTVVDGNGTWRFTPGTGLGEGQHNFTAVSEDKAGNRSGPSNTYGLELDFTAPAISDQSFSYAEDQLAGALVATVMVTDGNGVTAYQFKWSDNSFHSTSEDGFFAVNAQGQISLTASGASSRANDFETSANTWNYVVVALDAAGNYNLATVSLSETNLNDTAPFVGNAVAVNISEEGLSGAFADAAGAPDTTDLLVANGTVTVSDPDGNGTMLTLSAPSNGLSSDGVLLTWSGDGTSHLIGYGGASGTTPIIDVTIDNTGAYKVTLLGPVDQATGNGENVLTVNFGVNATDGTWTTSNPTAITVNIEDDSPLANPVSTVVVGTATVNSNLMFVLDLSGSMSSASGMEGLDRLQATVAAIREVLEQYGSIGDVMVNITTFGSTATGGTWMTVSQAETFLDSVSANAGNTNYDAGLAAAMSAFSGGGKLSGSNVQNVLYFLSDGAPNRGDGNTSQLVNADGGSGDGGIQAAEQTIWTNFLSANDINAFAVGLGTGVTVANMSPVAYDGINNQERDAISVTDLSNLSATLTSLVQSTVSGSIMTTGGFGADGGYLSAIDYGNNTFSFDGNGTLIRSGSGSTAYSFDSATHVLSLQTAGGNFVIDMDTGIYSFLSSIGTTVTEEVFGYTMTDNDGDAASAQFVIDFATVGRAPIARDDSVIVASGRANGNAVTLEDSWLLWNDSVVSGKDLSISSVSNATSHDAGQIIDAVSASSNGTGSFGYLISDGTQTDDASVTIATRNTHYLYGTGIDDIIVGDGADEILRGYAGNDVLVGNAGNDYLYGGEGADWLLGGAGNDYLYGEAGNDRLAGGAGNDNLTGGAGADLFVWNYADRGNPGSPATDTVTDFSTSTAGEALDLRDLLQGENHVAGIGNLASYLDITTSGSSTVIRVSSAGGFSNGNYQAGAEDQRITLSGVNLYSSYGVAAGDDASLIQKLLDNAKLRVD
ncbi:retention module-containing protein [Quatrionicoccus australiensis]|uniref:retention module-containing protein n=1 Tax=Quatrionicoccus australiensis TaxID=138118 RepID=UPI001CF96C10|nr:retention module-containing protein [Quatrionicoccus australiensis]MCB4360670.1 retention module-containing protein [Quatrionicoccus australiensis]